MMLTIPAKNYCKEYRANYEAGRTRAVYVHDLLNKYTDDDTGMKLGDLFLADTLQDKVGVQESVTAENKEKLPDLITIMLQYLDNIYGGIAEIIVNNREIKAAFKYGQPILG